ncbi:MAG: phosphoglycolate phosphatase, partial [Zoogloea sp.]|uniref:phosphoglycolate phosphatase n=1 Tax=Zoogloea sp. TaxID=49181 RepID=UPI003F2CFD85
TIDDLADGANGMLAELGRATASRDEIQGFVGRGIADLVQRCLNREGPADEATHAHALAVFKRHYHVCNGRSARAYPGVREGLDALKAKGLPLAVVTNKATDFTLPLLAQTGLAPYFSVVVCGDTLPQRKPHPAPLRHALAQLGVPPEANLHVGDSAHDAECARAAGCAVALLPYGYHGGQGVRGLDCDAIFDSLVDLVAALQP